MRSTLVSEKRASDSGAEGDDNPLGKRRRLSGEDSRLSDNSDGENSAPDEDDNTQDYFDDDNEESVAVLEPFENSGQDYIQTDFSHRIENKITSLKKPVTSMALVAALRLKKKARAYNFNRNLRPSSKPLSDDELITLDSPNNDEGTDRDDFASSDLNNGHDATGNSDDFGAEDRLVIEDDENEESGEEENENEFHEDLDSSAAMPLTDSGKLVRGGGVRHRVSMGRGSFQVFDCTECTFRSKSLINFKRHRRCHTDPARFRCGLCTYSSSMSSKISNHQRFHPNTPPKPMICLFDTPGSSEKQRGDQATRNAGGGLPRIRRWSVLNNSSSSKHAVDDADEDSIDSYQQQNSPPPGGFDESGNPLTTLNNFKLNYNCPFCPHKTPKKGNLKIHISRRHYRNAEAQGGLDACYANLHRSLDDWAASGGPEAGGNGTEGGGESVQMATADDWQQMETGDIRCMHCEYTAPTPYRMRLHVNSTHLQLRLYQCPACDHRSNWRSNVCKHIYRFHPGETRKVIFLSSEAGVDNGEGRSNQPSGARTEDEADDIVAVTSSSAALTAANSSSPFSATKLSFHHHHSEPVTRDRVVGPDGLTKSQRTDQRYSAARPFMCSECKFRSAWRHSVQQHIRVNARCRDAQLITLPTSTAASMNDGTPPKTLGSKPLVISPRLPLNPPTFSLRPLLPAPAGSGLSSLESDATPSTSAAAAVAGVDASVTISRFYGGKKCVKIFKCAECRYTTHMMHRMKKHTKLHRHRGTHRCPLCTFSSDLSKTVTFHLKHWHSDAEKDSLGTDALPLTMALASGGGGGLGSAGEDSAEEGSFQTAVDSYSLLQLEEGGRGVEENRQSWKCNACSFTTSRHDALKSHVQRFHPQPPAPRRNYSNLLRALGVAAAESSSGGGTVAGTAVLGSGNVRVKQEADEDDEHRSSSANEGVSGAFPSSAPRMLTCPICGYRTEHKFKMDPHIEAHSNRRRYMCAQCGQRANWRVVIRGHIRICHPGQNVDVIVLTDDQLRTLPHVEPGRMRMKMAEGREAERGAADAGDNDNDSSEFVDRNGGGAGGVGEARPSGNASAFPLYKCSACGFTSRSRPYTRKHMRRKHRKNQSHLMIVWLNTTPQASGNSASASAAAASASANAAPSGNRILDNGGRSNSNNRANVPTIARSNSTMAAWRCSVCSWSSKWPNNVYSHIMYKHGGDPEAKAIKMAISSGAAKMPFRPRLGLPTPLARLGDTSPKGRHFVSGLDRYWCRQCKYHSPYSHHVRRHILRKHAFSIQPVVDLTKDRNFLSTLSSADLAPGPSPLSSRLATRGQVGLYDSGRHSDLDMGESATVEGTLGVIAVRSVFNPYDNSSAGGQNTNNASPFIKQEVVDATYGDSSIVTGRNDLLSPMRSTATEGDSQSVDRLSNDGGQGAGADGPTLAPPFQRKRVKGRLFQCRYCPFQTYQTAERLLIHESLHGSGQRYQCRNCTYATAQYCNITKHLRMVHRLPEAAVSTGYTDRELDGLMTMGTVTAQQMLPSLPLATNGGWNGADSGVGTVVVPDDSQASSIGDGEDDRSYNRDDEGELEGSDVEMDALSSADNGDVDNNDNEGSSLLSLATVSGRVNETSIASNKGGDRPKVHRCRYCPFFSDSSDDLLAHVQGHQVCERLRCPFCTFSSATAAHLQLHIGLHFMALVEKAADDADAANNGSTETIVGGSVKASVQNGIAAPHCGAVDYESVGNATTVVENITAITYGRA